MDVVPYVIENSQLTANNIAIVPLRYTWTHLTNEATKGRSRRKTSLEKSMKIWAKTIRDDKITRNIVHECEFLANDYLYGEALRDICEKMDIPTPISTVTNYIHFVRFNMTRYQVRDFVESVDFDYLTIECIPEDK